MNERRYRSHSLRRPVTLFVVILVLIFTLTVLWNVVLVQDYQMLRKLAEDSAFHWTFIVLGSVLFLAIIIVSSMLGGQLISHIRWSQRQSNFFASVSHELNSPLSSIKLFTQTLRKRELDVEDRLNFVEKILFDVERLQRLIANILRAAEVDNRGDELQVVPQKVELYSYLQEHIQDAMALNEDSQLAITLAGEPKLWLELDRMMFRQVLDNLIDNAIRYRGEHPPRIQIRLLLLDGWVEIRVRDQGVGVPPEELPNLFDRFYRIGEKSPHHRRKGTGIGLYVVRSIVQAHGGWVRALSDGPGEGLTIAIRLPVERERIPESPLDRAAYQVARMRSNVKAMVEP